MSFKDITSWLSVIEYICHILPQISSNCGLAMNNMTGVISGAGSGNPSGAAFIDHPIYPKYSARFIFFYLVFVFYLVLYVLDWFCFLPWRGCQFTLDISVLNGSLVHSAFFYRCFEFRVGVHELGIFDLQTFSLYRTR